MGEETSGTPIVRAAAHCRRHQHTCHSSNGWQLCTGYRQTT